MQSRTSAREPEGSKIGAARGASYEIVIAKAHLSRLLSLLRETRARRDRGRIWRSALSPSEGPP